MRQVAGKEAIMESRASVVLGSSSSHLATVFAALLGRLRAVPATALTVGTNYELSRNNGTASGTQSASNVDYEYRTPYFETRAKHARARISLIDQKFESYMFEQNIPYLQKIFKNELASIDNDVYQLQIALLRSFLISPIPGIVTGIYKNPGDAVSAGEPVLRVENNEIVRLVATVVHRGSISIGSTATVATTLFGPSNPATTLTGSVVAARGQGDGNQWEIVVQTNNVDGSGNHILPLSYYFDRKYTKLIIS
jgi:biotin carboxyl carrier protein